LFFVHCSLLTETMESFNWAFEAFCRGEVFTAFDVETTGLNNRSDSIVEIGAIRFSAGGEIGRFSTLVNPGFPMPEEAAEVNNITDEMLEGQPAIQEVLPAFVHFAADSILIAHNAPFDCGFVNAGLGRLYDDGYVPFPALPNRVADTLSLARRLLPGRGRYNLQGISSDIGIQAIEAHRAFDDARLCMELFLHLAEKWRKGYGT
jgi:DNA polymerase-3 subunit epsilon